MSYESVNGYTVEEEFTLFVRSPWDWLTDLLCDPLLVSSVAWYPKRKYLVLNDHEERFWDDLDCGDDWWSTQVSFLTSSSS